MATTSSAMRDLSDQNGIGTRLGTTSTDLIGFYGVTTAVAKVSVGGSMTSGALASSIGFALQQMGLLTVSTFGA